MKLLFCMMGCLSAHAATVSLNESILVNTSPMRIGVNVSTSNDYDSGQLFKNLLFTVNPGFEGFIQQEIVGCISGTSITCVNYNQSDLVPSDYWAGATAFFCCSASSSDANTGLTRVITSNTASSGSAGPTYTFSSPLPQPVATDDYFSVALQVDSTGSGIPGWNLSGIAVTESTNIPAGSAGVQALSLPAGACAATFIDTTNSHDFIILQTGQTFGFSLKTIAISGNPVITVALSRLTGQSGGVTPSSNAMTPGATWATQTVTFSGNESTGVVYGALQVQICNTGTGTAYVDDADFERTSNLNASNTSVYRDEVVASLSAINPGSLRLWDYQLGETLADWTNPLFGRHFQSSLQGQTYVTTNSGRNAGSTAQGLMDFLGLCELLGAKAWITIPLSWPASDYSNLIDFLAGDAGTVYGAKRIANGHPATYTSMIGNIYIEFGNEPWNSYFAGIDMPNFSSATTTNGMLSYGYWSRTAMSTMKANSNFSPALQLIVNMQAVNTNEFTQHILPTNPYFDAVSIAPYIGGTSFNSAGTLTQEWNPDTAFTWGDSNDIAGDSGNGVTYAYVHSGPTPVYVYEDNENQVGGTVPVVTLQNHAPSFMAGTVVAQQMLEHLKILGPNAPQHIWSLAQDQYNAIPLYGIMKEAGGELAGTGNYVQRPVALATQIANDSLIGPEYSSTVTSADTYTTAASNGFAPESNVPYEFAYCFLNNANRSCVLVNTDPSSSHTFTLAGSNVPANVTTRVLSMAGNTIDACNNESASPCVSIVTTNNVPVIAGAITVAPGTIEGVDFLTGSSSGSDPPVISAVTSAVTNTSATITWTTDQPSSSQVEFGTTTSYGSLSALDSSQVTSHSVILTRLTPGTTYEFAVLSTDSTGSATSANYSFSTPASIPTISAITSGSITATTATITWTTDQPSTSQVAYGTTTAYGTLTTLSSTLVTSHSVSLTGLNAGATYDFAVLSGDSAGTATSGNFTFSTLATIPTISAVVSGSITATAATITWTTDQPSSSQVEYGTTTAYGSLSTPNSSGVTSHSVTITGLAPGTAYNYAVMSGDSAGSATSANYTFSTPASIPTISAVTSGSVTATTAIITWTTDQVSSSQVEYGTTTSRGTLSSYFSSLVTAHSVALTSLSPGTTYNFAAISVNSAGTATSANFTFSTLASAPLISAVTASAVGPNSATITWTTDQPASSQVESGVTTAYGSFSANNSSLVTSHSVTLTGLIGSTTYDYAAISTDSAGTSTSANFTFTTPPSIPVISAVAANNLTTSSATITWTTDQASSSQVEFGTTTAYGSLSSLNPSLVTAHTVVLTGLTPGATYDYAVISADSAGTTTSLNFTFSTPLLVSAIARVGGAHNNTGSTTAPSSLSIAYQSGNGNTIVAVCALGSTASSISSITDSGSAWALRAWVSNGTSVRSEVWTTGAGGSVASSSFTIGISGGAPASCALEEYSGVLNIGATATNETTSGTSSVSLTTQDNNNYVVAGLGANSYSGYNATNGTIRQAGGLTSNPGNDYVETVLSDNTAALASSVTCSSVSAPAPWAAVAVELRSASAGGAAGPVISNVSSTAVTATSATILWTTDEPSSSQVEYGTSSTYGSFSALNPSPVTSHSMTLTGLAPATTYNYVAISTDSGGTSASGNFTFSTPESIPVISAVAVSSITATSATVTWTTDQPSGSQVEYGTTTAYGSLSSLNSSPVTTHSVSLTGLNPGTTYDFAAMSGDSAGIAASANFTFTSSATIPAITAVTASGITTTSAIITWTTDQPASSQVEYGATTSYGTFSALNSSPATSHTVSLTGLTPGTTYDYAVISTDSAGTATSANLTFATPPITIPVISGVSSGAITATSASITWTTDQPSSSQVEFGITTGYGSLTTVNSSPVTSHSVVLSGLTPGTTYDYAVISTDSAGTATSANFTFSTPASIPAISAVNSGAMSSTSVTITWMTDQPSTSQVEFGMTTNYGSLSTLNSSPVTSHSVTLTGLTPGTTYDYATLSGDSAGTATSANFTFSTPASIPVVSAVSSGGIAATLATISWTTDQPSSSLVEFGTTNGYGSLSALNSSLVTAHSITLTGLVPGTTYDYAVISANSAGTATSANFTFSTPSNPVISTISPIGGAHNNTGSSSASVSLPIGYHSNNGNTLVAVCALGSTSSSISSITDSGSIWSLRAAIANGTSVRSEIWSTNAGSSVASTSFTISFSSGSPASCALQEYSGVLSIGTVATAEAVSGSWSVSQTTQEPNDYVVAGLGANSYYGYTVTSGTARQLTGVTTNSGSNYVEMALCDNTAATATGVSCTSVSGSVPWAAPALELRTVSAGPPTIPVISAVASGSIATTSAVITWTTDQPSTSQAEYGTTTAYGSLSSLNSSPVTSHSIILTGLTPGTTYDYAVSSTDSAGTATSANFTFATLPPAPVISAVTASNINTTSATISWTTDQPSSSQVEFGTTAAYGSSSALSSSPVTSHAVILTGLTPGTTYNYAVISADPGGSTTSANFTFMTQASLPVISNVTVSAVTTSSATITWSTDQPSSSQIEYGTTVSYGLLSTLNSSLVTSHSVTLTGLTPGTNYDYVVMSADSAGATTSVNSTFATPVPPPVISAVISGSITATAATITWTTDQPSSSQVEFGATATYGSLSTPNSSPVTSHSVSLTGLTPGTTYDYAVISTDSGGTTTSANFTFSTPSSIPVISAVTSGGISTTSATVTWTTDQPATSQVEFGATTTYGTLSTLNSSLVGSHSMTLTGLTPGATYDYAVISGDSAGSATSANFSFTTPLLLTPIANVGGAHNNTGSNSNAGSLSIAYNSGNGNTIVAVCALGNTTSSVSSITDSGSAWALRAYVTNGTAVRSEIWSTGAGGSVASKTFTVNISGGGPVSCALEEYSGVLAIGITATNEATSGSMSVSLNTQDANDYVVAGLGANSYNGYNIISGTLRQAGGLTSGPGNTYVEIDLCDNTAPTATTVTCSSVSGPAAWAIPALELR